MLYWVLYKLALVYWWVFRPITVGARVLLIKDNKILLVKHTYRDNWFPPGGGVKTNEILEDAAIRECKEEVGVSISNDSLILVDVLSNFSEKKRDYVAVYLCKNFEMVDRKDVEIEEAKWFNLNDLPDGVHPVWKKELEKLIALVKF